MTRCLATLTSKQTETLVGKSTDGRASPKAQQGVEQCLTFGRAEWGLYMDLHLNKYTSTYCTIILCHPECRWGMACGTCTCTRTPSDTRS